MPNKLTRIPRPTRELLSESADFPPRAVKDKPMEMTSIANHCQIDIVRLRKTRFPRAVNTMTEEYITIYKPEPARNKPATPISCDITSITEIITTPLWLTGPNDAICLRNRITHESAE